MFTKFTVDVENVQALNDRPNANTGLTADQVKAVFDQAGSDIKDFINNTLTPELDSNSGANLGIVNVMSYYASGLATTVTGNITTGTKILTLIGPLANLDFAAGQGINLQGAFEIASLQITAPASTSANCTVTLNGVAYAVALVSGDTAIQVATKIRAATYVGWTAGGTALSDTVTFTANSTGTKTDASYSAGTTGATGTMSTTTQGTADQISRVSSVSGYVVTIADNSTRTITAGTISHDDTAAILAAGNAAIANSVGQVFFPKGTYNTGPNVFQSAVRLTFQGDNAKIVVKRVLDTTYEQAPFAFRDSSFITIRGFEIDGGYSTFSDLPTNTNNMNLAFFNCTNVIIENNYLHDSGWQKSGTDKFGDGIYFKGDSNGYIKIRHNKFKDNGRWAIAILSGSYIDIHDNENTITDSTSPSLGFIDLEYGASAVQGVKISIHDNMSKGNTVINFSGANGFSNVDVHDNLLDGNRLDGTSSTGNYSYGIQIAIGSYLKIHNNFILNSYAAGAVQLVTCTDFDINDNIIDGLAVNGIYLTTSCVRGRVNDNYIKAERAAGNCVEIKSTCDDIRLNNNKIINSLNFGIISDGTNVVVKNNDILSGVNLAFRLQTNAHTVVGNKSSQSGRLSAIAHTVMYNNMTIGTTSGNWWEGSGTYVLPDISKRKNRITLTAPPTTGTPNVGDVIDNSAPTLLKNISHWTCITSNGTGGVWTACGCGTGTTANRPTLGTNDAGYLYYDTTTTTKIFWTGSAWA